jgi:hypothetical protein
LKGENPVTWVIARNVLACNFLRTFVFEDRATDCEKDSQAALTKWIEHRRANARMAIRLDPRILETYVGQYRLETFDRTVTVTREGDRLFVNGKSELFGESASTFFLKIRPLQMTFMKDEGRVTRIEVVEDGETLRANRIR